MPVNEIATVENFLLNRVQKLDIIGTVSKSIGSTSRIRHSECCDFTRQSFPHGKERGEARSTERHSCIRLSSKSYLVLVNNPTLSSLVICLVTAAFLGDLIHGQVFQSNILRQLFAMHSLSYSGGPGNYHIRRDSHTLRLTEVGGMRLGSGKEELYMRHGTSAKTGLAGNYMFREKMYTLLFLVLCTYYLP